MKKLISFLLAALMIFSLCACGSSSNSASDSKQEASTPMESAANDDIAYDEEADYGGLAAEEGGLSADGTGESSGDINPDKIIYSADATLETTDFDTAVEKLGALIEQYGGFIESSSVRGVNIYNRNGYGRRSADYTVRIPSENFSTLMNELPGIGNVPYTHTYTDNITAQYYDAQARLTAYEAQEQSLLAMLEKAETVEDIINIEDKLTDVRYNIDSVKSRLTNWDRQVSYSTVNLSVEEVVEYSPEAKISYGERLWLSLKNGLKSVGDFFSDFLVWFVGALPALVILAVLIVVLLPLLRKWNRRSREKRAARKAAKAEKSGEN